MQTYKGHIIEKETITTWDDDKEKVYVYNRYNIIKRGRGDLLSAGIIFLLFSLLFLVVSLWLHYLELTGLGVILGMLLFFGIPLVFFSRTKARIVNSARTIQGARRWIDYKEVEEE